MGKTGEVSASGIQSVATGVGSAENTCMHAFSKPDHAYVYNNNEHHHHHHHPGGIISAGTRNPRSGMVSVGQSLVEGLLLRSSGNIRDSILVSNKMYAG